MNSTVLYLEKMIPFSCLLLVVKSDFIFFQYSSCPSLSSVLIYLGNFIESITAPSVKKRESVNYDQLQETYQPVNNSLIISATGQSRQKHMKTVI